LPGLENAALDAGNPPSARRMARWVDAGICVASRPEWVFVKVHAHGAPEANAEALLGPAGARFHEDLARWKDGGRLRLHYVSARELVNIVLAAEAGESGDPGRLRDWRYRCSP
jgi:hypothetical protein